MKLAGVTAADLWGDLAPEKRTLWTARVFPVFECAAVTVMGDEDYSGDADSSTDAHALVRTPSTQAKAFARQRRDLQRSASLWMQRPHAVPVHQRELVVSTWRSAERVSFADVLQRGDAAFEFTWRRALRDKVCVCVWVLGMCVSV